MTAQSLLDLKKKQENGKFAPPWQPEPNIPNLTPDTEDNQKGICYEWVTMWVRMDRVAAQDWNVAQKLVCGTGQMLGECGASKTM